MTFAQDVPHRNINAADCVGERSAAAEPKRVRVEFLADSFGFERIFADVERLQNIQTGLHEPIVREGGAPACYTFIGKNGYQRVNAIVRLDLVRPAALGSGST